MTGLILKRKRLYMEDKGMEGYVRNKSHIWRHAMKRAVAPNGKVQLDDLYKQYSIKHDIEEGKQFVEWLRQIKLRDESIWEIVYDEGTTVQEEKIDEGVEPPIVEEKEEKSDQPPFVSKEKEVDDIVGMTVRQARDELPKINDLKLLKYSLTHASQLSNKDTLCILMQKRIKELELRR
jgi:hypothetical protein